MDYLNEDSLCEDFQCFDEPPPQFNVPLPPLPIGVQLPDANDWSSGASSVCTALVFAATRRQEELVSQWSLGVVVSAMALMCAAVVVASRFQRRRASRGGSSSSQARLFSSSSPGAPSSGSSPRYVNPYGFAVVSMPGQSSPPHVYESIQGSGHYVEAPCSPWSPHTRPDGAMLLASTPKRRNLLKRTEATDGVPVAPLSPPLSPLSPGWSYSPTPKHPLTSTQGYSPLPLPQPAFLFP